MKKFDYYIYIDYSKNLVGYAIIEKEKINILLPKLSKLDHYRNVKHKKQYISTIRKKLKKEKIKDLLLKCKIVELRLNLTVFADVVNFIIKNCKYKIFVSIDDNQYYPFVKLLKIIPDQKYLVVIKESDLERKSMEYRLNLIVDNMLNIKRKVSK